MKFNKKLNNELDTFATAFTLSFIFVMIVMVILNY
jgi:hypothetical protein